MIKFSKAKRYARLGLQIETKSRFLTAESGSE